MTQRVDRPYLDFAAAPAPPVIEQRPKALLQVLPPIPTRNVPAGTILDCVAQAYLIDRAMLTSSDKHKSVTEARKVAYWLLRELTTASYPEIGRALRKDQSCGRVGVISVEKQRRIDPAFLAFTDELRAAVKARLGCASDLAKEITEAAG